MKKNEEIPSPLCFCLWRWTHWSREELLAMVVSLLSYPLQVQIKVPKCIANRIMGNDWSVVWRKYTWECFTVISFYRKHHIFPILTSVLSGHDSKINEIISRNSNRKPAAASSCWLFILFLQLWTSLFRTSGSIAE